MPSKTNCYGIVETFGTILTDHGVTVASYYNSLTHKKFGSHMSHLSPAFFKATLVDPTGRHEQQ